MTLGILFPRALGDLLQRELALRGATAKMMLLGCSMYESTRDSTSFASSIDWSSLPVKNKRGRPIRVRCGCIGDDTSIRWIYQIQRAFLVGKVFPDMASRTELLPEDWSPHTTN